MMYKVIKYFTDLHDNNYPYSVGDTYPRMGLLVSQGRLAELASSNNRQGQPLIKLVEEAAPKKPAKKTAERGA